MDQSNAIQVMNEIADTLRSAGYDPYDQLVGYIQTGEDYYITRQNNAREKIHSVDVSVISQYINELK